MGVYLNSKISYLLYHREYMSTYFVDKTEIIRELEENLKKAYPDTRLEEDAVWDMLEDSLATLSYRFGNADIYCPWDV